MKWRVLFVLLAIGVSNASKAQQTWNLFADIPHMTSKNSTCENTLLKALRPELLSRGFSEESLEKIGQDMESKLKSDDLLRPLIAGNDILIGTNLRWRSVSENCRNYLLHCKVDRPDGCKEIATLPNNQVLTPRFFNGNSIIADRSTFVNDALNSGSVDYVASDDLGKSWRKIDIPVPCSSTGYNCTLLPRTAQIYMLLSSKINQDATAFQDFAVHTTANAGLSWRIQAPAWSEIKHHFYVSAQNENLIAIPEVNKGYFSISQRNTDTDSTEITQTKVSVSEWESSYSRVFGYRNKYLVLAQGKMDASKQKNVGIFFIDKSQQQSSEKPAWTSQGKNVKDIKISDRLVVVRTWDSNSMSKNKRNFNESIHYTTDDGIHWHTFEVSDELLGNTIEVSENRIWMLTPSSILYIDVPAPKPD